MPGSVDPAVLELFRAKAKAATIEVAVVQNIREAMLYAVSLAGKAEPAQVLPTGAPPKGNGAAGKKVLAAPGIPDELYAELERQAEAAGVEPVRSGLRDRLAGIEAAFSIADLGIAETATLIQQNEREDARLATMICETHVVALPVSSVVKSAREAEDYLRAALAKVPNYTSFISGPSRTADIERVLTLGVHGPLAMHVTLMEG
ncbi:MAG: lactate utilization protein [Deltaproteobacteria bacterium]|jgi:L-lactate dehydrogenase complex protein LldG|nr:lactate utilization protein [Deltaproteobacteria bacterium]